MKDNVLEKNPQLDNRKLMSLIIDAGGKKVKTSPTLIKMGKEYQVDLSVAKGESYQQLRSFTP